MPQKLVDVVGQRYGRLVVVERTTIFVKGRTVPCWKCQCDCGNIAFLQGSNVRRGNTKSCGCYRREKARQLPLMQWRLPLGEAAFNDLWNDYKVEAKKRGLCWALTREQARERHDLPCHYCGTAPAQTYRNKQLNGVAIYNGIDRVNNALGYVLDNCVACYWLCNRNKGKLSADEFKAWVRRVYEHACRIS